LISQAAAVANLLWDVEHDIGLAVHVGEDKTFAYAVVQTSNGEILAWDGWIGGGLPEGSISVMELGWDGWDDFPTKLLAEANGPWLKSHLGYFLVPTYSVARQAAKLVEAHWDSPNYDETPQRFASSYVAAYLPIAEREVFFTELKRRAAESRELHDRYRRLGLL